MTEIQRTDEYEDPALEWFFREAERLDQALLAGGVADETTRREICTQFFFGFGAAFAEPVESDGRSYRVVVALEADDDRLLLPTDLFDFHEYAHGVVGEVYGDS